MIHNFSEDDKDHDSSSKEQVPYSTHASKNHIQLLIIWIWLNVIFMNACVFFQRRW